MTLYTAVPAAVAALPAATVAVAAAVTVSQRAFVFHPPLLRTAEEAANARLAPRLDPRQYRQYSPSQLVRVNSASVYTMLWWMLAGVKMKMSTAVDTTRTFWTTCWLNLWRQQQAAHDALGVITLWLM